MAKDKTSNGPNGSAPTTTTEALVIVRPLKVIAVILAALAMLMMLLSVAATSWLEADRRREGLWGVCVYSTHDEGHVDCDTWLRSETGQHTSSNREWLQVCRGLCLLAMVLTVCGIVVTSVGLRSSSFRYKSRYYTVGMVLWFLADGLQLSSLVMFPVKFLDDILTRDERHWQFGWAYGVGWGAAIFVFVAGLMLLIDKGKEELVYREVTAKNKVAEEEEATEVV